MKPRADWIHGRRGYDGVVLRGTVMVWLCEHDHQHPQEALACAEHEIERGEAELHRPGGGKGKAVVPVDANADIP